MSFGKSRHKVLNESTKKVTFADIAGIDEAKRGTRRDHRLPSRAEKIYPSGWSNPEGGSFDGTSRNRENSARSRSCG